VLTTFKVQTLSNANANFVTSLLEMLEGKLLTELWF